MKTIRKPFVIALVLALCGVTASIAQTTGTIRGYVLEGTNGDPAPPGANLILQGTVYGGTTSADGSYVLLGIPPGTYTIVINLVGYTTWNATGIVVEAGQTTTRDIILNPFLVTNDGDSGPGSLRQALIDADSISGPGWIYFDLPGPDVTISLLSPLPSIHQRVVLDATSQQGTGYVELDGSGAGVGATGLTVEAPSCVIRGLVINRFSGDGISIISGDGNLVEGNRVGTDATGALASPNGGRGVVLNSAGNTVGGTTPASRNVLSGNAIGLVIQGTGANNNTVRGNYIGLNAAGDAAIRNRQQGVFIGNGTGNVIGGTSPGARNVISGNTGHGVIIIDNASGNVIIGNYIGTNASGSDSIANGTGVHILRAQNNQIGGSQAGEGNLISGNAEGILIYGEAVNPSTGNTIEGNLVGTDAGGGQALPNVGNGIRFDVYAQNNTIGGTQPGSRNIVSGNGEVGIFITQATATGNTVRGNYVGTDKDGASQVPNGTHGVHIYNALNTSVEQNILSGNASYGLWVGGSASGTVIHGNYIGLNAAGTDSIGNTWGVGLNSVPTTLGGTNSGDRNVISGNRRDAVDLYSGWNRVIGNYIGTDKDGLNPVPNGTDPADFGAGFWVMGNGNTIGGATAAEGNLVAYNDGVGIALAAGSTWDIAILSNRIFGNALLGIDLGAADSVLGGVTLNDPGDWDSGPNYLQNFPVIDHVAAGSGYVRGTLSSMANTGYRVQIFRNSSADTSGYGEGEEYVGSVPVTTDESGTASFSANFPVTFSVGEYVTATATNDSMGTSEFSRAYRVAGATASLSPTAGYVASEFVTQLAEPEGLALDRAGNLIVAVRGTGQVIRYSGAGSPTVIADQFQTVVDVVVNSGDTLYAADMGTGSVYAIDLNDPAGWPLDARALSPVPILENLKGPVQMALGPNGRMYYSFAQGSVDEGIYSAKLPPGYMDTVGVALFPPGTDYDPAGIAFADDGDMYFALNRRGQVLRFDVTTPNFTDATKLPVALDGLTLPSGIDIGPDGRIYVVTSNRIVTSRENSQTWSTFFTGLSGGSANDLVFDDKGTLYVSDPAGGRIIKLEAPLQQRLASGSLTYVISQEGDPAIADGSDTTAIRNGFAHWQDVQTSALTFVYGGYSPATIASAADGVNLVTFQDDEFPFPPFVLAVASKTIRLGSTPGEAEIIDADIVFNPAYSSTTSEYSFGTETKYGLYDIESIVTHESGHTAGLVHSGVPSATMFFVLQPDTGARSLVHDDEAWASHLYPENTYAPAYGSITGTIDDGEHPGSGVAGALVLGINAASGDSVHGYSTADGQYTLPWLHPGEYSVWIHPLDGDLFGLPFTAANVSAYLQALTQVTDYPSEFYDAAESATDDPNAFTPVTVAAGAATPNVNVTTNLDRIPPSVVSVFPTSGATGVAVASEILVTFSEAVSKPTVTLSTFTVTPSAGGNPVPGSFLFLQSNTTAVFTPSKPLAFQTDYTIALTSEITDRKSNALAPFTSSFTTVSPDVAAPSVEQVVPANGATGVFTTAPVTVVFSEPIDPNSVVAGSSFTLAPVTTGTVTFEQGNKVMKFKPAVPLSENTTYTIGLTTNIKDLAGNSLSSLWSSAFTVIPSSPPSIVAFGPGPNEIGVGVSTPVLVDFSEPIDSTTVTAATFHLTGPDGAVSGAYDFLLANSRVVFRPDADLKYSATYTVRVTAGVKDLSGAGVTNTLASDFTTAAAPAVPEIFTIFPPNAKVGAGVSISGQGFDPDPDKNTVSFNGTVAAVTTATLNSLAMSVPLGATTGPVTVTVDGSTSASFQFVVLDPVGDPINEVIATVGASGGTRSAATTPDGAYAYVTNSGSNSVTAIDLNSLETVGTPIGVGSSPLRIAINPAGSLAYVTNYGSNTISVIDITLGSPTYNQVVATIPVGINPVGIFVTPDGTRVYVGELTSKSISVIDVDPSSGGYNNVVATVNTSSGNKSAAVSPDGTLAFFTGTAGLTILDVSPVSASYNNVIATVNPSTGTRDVAVKPDGTLAVVTTDDAQLWIVDINQKGNSFGNVIAQVPTSSGSRDVKVSPDGTLVYVTDYEDNSVDVYQFTTAPGPSAGEVSSIVTLTPSLKLIDTIPVGTNPEGIAIVPSGEVAVVANVGSDNVSVINIRGVRGDYVLFATNSLALESGAVVRSGNIVVNTGTGGGKLYPDYEIGIGPGAKTPALYAVRGDRISVLRGAVVASDVYYNALTSLGTITGALKSPLPLPVYASVPPFATGPVGTADVVVASKQKRTLPPGTYRDIKVGSGGTLTLDGGVYNTRGISVGNEGKIQFAGRTEIRVQNRFYAGSDAVIGASATAGDVIVYVAGINGTAGGLRESPMAAQTGLRCRVGANLYVPNGTLNLGAKNIATGSFLGKDVLVDMGATVSFASYFMRSQSPEKTGSEIEDAGIPQEFALLQNYPNPFNPSTTIEFHLPEALERGAVVRLVVYNVLGQEVARLVEEEMQPGRYAVVWDGRNRHGQVAASGMYIYRLEAGSYVKAAKMMLVK